jgi:nitroreductase
MTHRANPDYPVHELLAARWSPYGFADRSVSKDDLRALFEAARWAPSSYNEQPWRYIVATREQPAEFQKILACLWDLNQAWARYAPVLVLALTSEKLSRSGDLNRAAQHDLGLAAGNICVEATARGLNVHQMIGIHPEKVRETFTVPEGYLPLTALAIGYASNSLGKPSGSPA